MMNKLFRPEWNKNVRNVIIFVCVHLVVCSILNCAKYQFSVIGNFFNQFVRETCTRIKIYMSILILIHKQININRVLNTSIDNRIPEFTYIIINAIHFVLLLAIVHLKNSGQQKYKRVYKKILLSCSTRSVFIFLGLKNSINLSVSSVF